LSDKLNSHITVSISELTRGTRSILYSAHLLWDSPVKLLVAAGTAFGEIIYWSWSQNSKDAPVSQTHHIFASHEGSIFGVRISKELPPECCHQLKRVIASCSDDRTIRIWDISDSEVSEKNTRDHNEFTDGLRTRHTGFSSESFDENDFNSLGSLAIGWGHASRIWMIRFLEVSPNSESLFLKSAGEDATVRIWELALSKGCMPSSVYGLAQVDWAAYHSGKNLWAIETFQDSKTMGYALCGGADSKITASPLPRSIQATTTTKRSALAEYSIEGILSLAKYITAESTAAANLGHHKSSKEAEFFRGYCFVDTRTVLFTMNSGKVLEGSLCDSANPGMLELTELACIAHLHELSGYSICTSGSVSGIAFVAGATGDIFIYRKDAQNLMRIDSAIGKVGGILTANLHGSAGQQRVAVLITVVGQSEAQLLYIDVALDPQVFRTVTIPISVFETGSIITSMAHVSVSGTSYVFLGFRRGSIAIHRICQSELQADRATSRIIIDKAHAYETVTQMHWLSSTQDPLLGHLISIGRDGRLTVHQINLSANVFQLVTHLTMPFGPNIEGMYFLGDHLMIYGFHSRKWILYDVTAEEEIMGVDTGGAHRGWTYQPYPSEPGGSLVWTQAASMRIYRQIGCNHAVIRSGGHGREIKAVAVTAHQNGDPCTPLIATGAEDTDIKIFQYVNEELTCIRTLRQHTTGIQHLQWSEDGKYLFSSGGCEEFYIWRIHHLPSYLGVGVVCEHVYTPVSENADLRLMSFDVRALECAYEITMVFSDSSIKLYRYTPAQPSALQTIAGGIYLTSCITQCVFLSSVKVLTVGTDGYAIVWPLMSESDEEPTSTLGWEHPTRIHQNSSKAMAAYQVVEDAMLVVSGGDDGSLAFLLASTETPSLTVQDHMVYTCPPIVVSRAHSSAVTACAVVVHGARSFILTCGNDEWIRLWEVKILVLHGKLKPSNASGGKHEMEICRLKKVKTSVADVSSMAVLATSEESARVLLCGVGMEVIRLDWEI